MKRETSFPLRIVPVGQEGRFGVFRLVEGRWVDLGELRGFVRRRSALGKARAARVALEQQKEVA